MKISIVRIMAALLVIIVCVGSVGYYYFQKQQHEEEERRAEALRLDLLNKQQIAQIKAQQFSRNEVDKFYPRPVSDWKATEKSIYQKLLSGGKFDVLIVPFQVQEYALDRPTRSLMTAELALAISAAQKTHVPDSYLVARALGDGDRVLDPREVYSFADKIGIKKIIWGYVGHNRANQMSLSVKVEERNSNGIFNAQATSSLKKFEHISFSDEQPPIEIYQSMLPEILTALGVDNSALTAPKSESRFDVAELPPSPLAMVNEKQEPARDALYFQLLAALTPHDAERTQERFAEKSLLAILSMSPDSPDYRVLKARAFMLLGLRPAALQVLGEPKTIEEKGLVAALNGNLPDVELFSSQIKPSIKKLIAKLDANNIDSDYGGVNKNKSIAAANSLKLQGEMWQFLAVRAFSDRDYWAQFNNIHLKQLLDNEFPIKDYTAEGLVRGTASLGDSDKLKVLADLSVINHVRKLLEVDTAKWCCQSTPDRLAALDYLNLIEALGENNLVRRAYFLTTVQGVPEQAIEFLDRIEYVYKSHPQFVLARAQAQMAKAGTVDSTEKEGLLKSAYENFVNAFYWEQGQSVTSATAISMSTHTDHNDYGYNNLYVSDYPFRAYYEYTELSGVGASESNAKSALKNSTSDFKPFSYLYYEYTRPPKQDDKFNALLKSVEGRFQGNPALSLLLAQNSSNNGDIQAAEKYYRDSIKAAPLSWDAYIELGNLLIEQGQLEQASKLFMNYPAFQKDTNANPVRISNDAYQAGSRLYWIGEFALATPLYELASRQETGSAADLTSRLRLKLINGDYRGALLGSLERAQRYNDSYAYRDFLGMLHAMGASKEAWDAFNVLGDQFNNQHIWETALVGHRKEGKSEGEIIAWVKQSKDSNHAGKYLLRAGVTDRIPSKEFATFLTEIAEPVWKLDYGNKPGNDYFDGLIVQLINDGKQLIILGPQSHESGTLPLDMYKNTKKTQVKSHLSYFADAYRAIRTNDFSSAHALLQEASNLYKLSMEQHSYLLPYYAFAAAKMGDAPAVEKYMADFTVWEKSFDYFLAKAIISGIAGKTEESVKFLKSALYKRPFTEERPLQTEYQYAEICELLYEATGNSAYKEIALDWAKKNQKFQPWFAWAYAMEAKLSNNKAERKRAIAMAFYLDPQSERLGGIPQKEREAAVKEFGRQNPFLRKKAGENESSSPRQAKLGISLLSA
ncbi:tetratricopeptide repeat protein [Methylobacter sp.]|uniref:tetratricopeptide repeat protein n=1 Tax=Methylobacter sp. TaxID=2051955 RepID=UPI0011FFDFDF|nr:tetratricopeptide repeat protein [Methylobacter sp.]TAK63888.1 MAG: tetratricopeptide repeat protein [Methylobacter sp.]